MNEVEKALIFDAFEKIYSNGKTRGRRELAKELDELGVSSVCSRTADMIDEMENPLHAKMRKAVELLRRETAKAVKEKTWTQYDEDKLKEATKTK